MSRKQTYVIVLLTVGVCVIFGALLVLVFKPISAPPPNAISRDVQTLPQKQTPISPAPTATSVLLAAASPTPRGASVLVPLATVIPTPGMMSISRCGNYNVTQQVGSGGRVTSIIVSNSQGQIKKTFKADAAASATVQMLWCADITGTGTSDLVVQTYSGGARCCSTYDIVSMTESFPVHLHWEAGSGTISQVVMLGGRLPYEIVGTDDRFMNFDSPPFAVPLFLPVVFVFRNGKYVAATRDYPQILRDDQTKAQQALGTCSDESCQKSLALKIYADGVWLNEDSQTFTKVKSQVKPSVAAWLDSVRASALKVLSK